MECTQLDHRFEVQQVKTQLCGGLIGGRVEEWIPLQDRLKENGIQLYLDIFNPTIQPLAAFSKNKDFLLISDRDTVEKVTNSVPGKLCLYWGIDPTLENSTATQIHTADAFFFLLFGLASRTRSVNASEDTDLYRKALEKSSSGILLLDEDGTVLFANLPAYNSLLENTHGSLIGKNIYSFLDAKQKDEFSSFLVQLSEKNDTGFIRITAHTRLESKREIDITGNCLNGSSGQAKRYFCILKTDESKLYRKSPARCKHIAEKFNRDNQPYCFCTYGKHECRGTPKAPKQHPGEYNRYCRLYRSTA